MAQGGASYIHRRGKTWAAALFLLLLSLGALCVVMAVGSAGIPLPDTLRTVADKILGRPAQDPSFELILFRIRLPRALTAFFVGAALSVSGACMQGLFQNAMADPHIMGVSSGAALGAALGMLGGFTATFFGLSAIALCAFAGGLCAVLMVAALARGRGRSGSMTLLLSGVAVSAFLSALLSGVMVVNRHKMEQVLLWTMGSFAASNWQKFYTVAPLILGGALVMLFFARDLNVMLLGEEEARGMGVRVSLVRGMVVVFSTLTTSAAVSVSGIIGFVGLMVPHAVRLVMGPDHRSLIPISFLGGGLYLMAMDTLARTVASPQELPVGVLTAFVGGPFFLWLLRRGRAGG